jgi:prepilin-type N-terminal cleavage/methylation domain-containing protein
MASHSNYTSVQCRGLTLIEIMVAASVFSVAMVIAMQATLIMNKSAASGIQYSAVSKVASCALARMAEELGPARDTSIALSDHFEPASEAPYDYTITFRQLSWNATTGAVQESGDVVIRWQVAERCDPALGSATLDGDNVDNNGNGIFDEGQVVLDKDGYTGILIADRVPEGGFQVRRTGNGLDLTLKLYYLITEAGEVQQKIATFNTTITLTNN